MRAVIVKTYPVVNALGADVNVEFDKYLKIVTNLEKITFRDV
jgi:hypothetical protein